MLSHAPLTKVPMTSRILDKFITGLLYRVKAFRKCVLYTLKCCLVIPGCADGVSSSGS